MEIQTTKLQDIKDQTDCARGMVPEENRKKSDSLRRLKRNNWALGTWHALSRLMQENGAGSPGYDCQTRPYAVFDCDNTTVINDLEETLLIYQLEHLKFSISPWLMQDVLETGIPDVEKPLVSGFENEAGQAMNVRMLAQDCAGDYPMLTDFADMKLGLIINRVRSDSIQELAQQAVRSAGQQTARYVLQGRDENQGIFRPYETSVLLGESEEKLVD